MMEREQDSSAENPGELTGLKQQAASETAGGLTAIASTFSHIVAETGLFRGLKGLSHLNKKGGFDCPSCAWPDPDDERSRIAEYCENGAKAVADEATSKRLDPDFFSEWSIEKLSALSDLELGKNGRVAQPMWLSKGSTHYRPITWEAAFEKIASSLNTLSSPDQAIFYTSGRTSNEAAFLYQLFVREFGTNNLPDCSNMCHESSGVALGESLGIGKGSVKLDDFDKAEVIIILGQNPGTNHPRMLTALQKAKANGATIISINPLPEAGLMGFANPQQLKGWLGMSTQLTDLFLQVKINRDMPLLQLISKLLVDEDQKSNGGVCDHQFISTRTEGWKEFKEHLEKLDQGLLVDSCGVELSKIHQAVDILKTKKKIIACWAMGLTQHKNAVDTIKEIVNLLLLKGSIGKPGAGTCPVRGHSNVQGDRTMGINERPSQHFLDSIERTFQFRPPQKAGYDVVEAIKAMHNGKARVFLAMGGNFLSATPDTRYTAEALRKCKLTVHISTKLNRSHLVHGQEAIILPCLARSDKDTASGKPQFVSCENSMGVVQSSRGVLTPLSDQLLSEPAIVCGLASSTLGTKSKVNWPAYAKDYDLIRADIEKTIPGFENYNERIRVPGGFYLPNGNRDGRFDTPSRKAQFNVAYEEAPHLKAGELIMMTIRSHDQFNTTIYGLDDRYRGIYNERRVILMSRCDLETRALRNGDLVDISNHCDGVDRVARKFVALEYSIPAGCTATYFPETNVLVPIGKVADKSGTPASKSVIIEVVKHLAYD
jgi:molybdopterin-dependent oxidoreductase alpha subunit